MARAGTYTARVWPLGLDPFPIVQEIGAAEYNRRVKEAQTALEAINKFSLEQFGRTLPTQCWKDYHTLEIWDDRAVQVIPNTGLRADGKDINQ